MQAWLVRQFGASYRTTLSGWSTIATIAAGIILTNCPHLVQFEWDRHEAGTLFWTVAASGLGMKFAAVTKDVSATGVQK